MSDPPTIPTTKTQLDPLVMWAVGVLQSELGHNETTDISAYVASKVGKDPQVRISDFEHRAVRRALERLQDAYLVQYDTGDGWRLGPENE